MTEITNINDSLIEAQSVSYLGKMGRQWGVSRSVPQIHALLFLGVSLLNAEDSSDRFGAVRSNVSNFLRKLGGRKLMRCSPGPGDGREHFVAGMDRWKTAMCTAQDRKKREIDPAISAIDNCVQHETNEPHFDPIVLGRMHEWQGCLKTADRCRCQMLNTLMKMGDKVFSLLKLTGKKTE